MPSKKGGDIITAVSSLVAPTGINPLVTALGLTALSRQTKKSNKKSQKGGNPNSNGSTPAPLQFYGENSKSVLNKNETMTGECGRINPTSAPCRNLCPFPNASPSQYNGKKKTATKKPATKKPATKKPATKKPATKKPATKKDTKK